MPPAAALVFAGKSVAGPAISFLLNKAFSYLNGYFGTESMGEMRTKLDTGMLKIQAVLDVVSPDQIKDKSEALDKWFWKLRDAVEEAEDAIDNLEYLDREEKANDQKISDWGSPFAKMKHKVVRSVKHVGILDKTVKQLTHRHTVKKLMKAMENMEKVVVDIPGILDVTQHVNGAASSSQLQVHRETGSTLSATTFVGREKEKEQIIGWLAKTSVQSAEIVTSTNAIPIFSVVGHGGMGKTTLAQSICEEDEVLKNYKVIWVTVSTSFDATSVTSKILECATGAKPSANHLEPLQQDLKEKLKSNNFLLVLDDVWEDKNRDEWEKLFAPMRKVDTRTKILLTTRMQSVADMAVNVMGVERDQYLTLEGLEQDENIELFNHYVFSGPHPHDYVHLTSIGDQIATKLGGCPLVTKVVGGHLQSNMTSGYWRKFLDKNLEHFKGTAEDIMKVLRLSYYHLPTELQICFRYCSLFAEDYQFKKKELVQMWMGSGLISHATSDSITPEDIGEQFLAQLTRKSFFDVKSIMYSYGCKEEYFVMHDLMHELARNVSFGECARITNPDTFENMKDTVRHLYISCIHGFSVEEVKKVSNLKNLRTIIIDGNESDLDKDCVCTLANFVESSKSLRLFRSELRNTFCFAVKFGELKHLRYIYLDDDISPELICGVAKLYHLILLLCPDGLQREAKQVRYLGCLESLRYVTYGVNGLGEFPIGSLTSLQELNNYRVQGSMGNKISAIKSLRGLRVLRLSGLENVENHEEVISAKLNEKTNLVSLSLMWSGVSQNRIDDLVLDHLEPHGNIGNLSIYGCKGLKLPFWIENLSVKNLVSLSLTECINWEHLPSLAELVLLRKLRLCALRKLEQIGRSCDMSSRSSMELLLPPNLHTLEVSDCQELRELPILPPGLVRLHIEGTRLTTLPMMGKTSSESTSPQLVCISVTDCPFLTSLEGSLFEQRLYMGALRELQIRNCIHLESASLPFEEMNRLEELKIRSCPELRAMRDAKSMLLPSSLRGLNMGQCGELELPLLGTLQRLTNLFSLSFVNCSCLVSLPSVEVFITSLKSLQYLGLLECENLSSLGGLGSLPSLGQLYISKCSKLVVAGLSLAADVSGAEEEHLVNPGSSLQIGFLSIDSPSLLLVEPLKSLCHTRQLSIRDGAEMKSLPEGWLLQNHPSLLCLYIYQAKSLESLPPSMPGLSSLQELIIRGAEQLQSLANLPSSLQELTVEGAKQLQSLPDLPSSLQKLTVEGAKQLQSLPDLPSSLQKLTVEGAKQLQSLPDLPSSLHYLEIQGCHPDLEKKIRELASPKRNKICHLHLVSIGNSHFIMGKECSEETFKRLRWSEPNTLISWADQQKEEKRLTWWKKPNCLKIAS